MLATISECQLLSWEHLHMCFYTVLNIAMCKRLPNTLTTNNTTVAPTPHARIVLVWPSRENSARSQTIVQYSKRYSSLAFTPKENTSEEIIRKSYKLSLSRFDDCHRKILHSFIHRPKMIPRMDASKWPWFWKNPQFAQNYLIDTKIWHWWTFLTNRQMVMPVMS